MEKPAAGRLGSKEAGASVMTDVTSKMPKIWRMPSKRLRLFYRLNEGRSNVNARYATEWLLLPTNAAVAVPEHREGMSAKGRLGGTGWRPAAP